ncbi:MAG: phosphotransferase [Prevotella sp.]|nr:phosphotransferase [Prevotella sp.]
MRTAVILAARKEKGSAVPFPLKRFSIGGGRETCLFERILETLDENHYERIYVVTGYRKELFAEYASGRVILIENKDYEFTSSMGSLAVVESYVEDDFLLIESDTFFEKKLIERMSQVTDGNCFSVTEESGNGDEAFVQLRHGHVGYVSKDRHQIANVDGEMIGVTRIASETFARMCREYGRATNPWVNYEYLLLACTDVIDRPALMFSNIIWGEVDNEEEFRRLENYIYPRLRRKENPYDRENLYDHLRAIFPNETVDGRWKVDQIGGMSNKNFKVVSPQGDEYILRVPGIGSDGMVERSNEDVNGLLGSRLGLNPDVRYFNSATGVKLADFIHDAETLNSGTIQRMPNMRKIAGIFRTLHSAKVRMANEFNVFHEVVRYERLLEQCHGTVCEGYAEVRARVMGLERYLNELGVELAPCHNDLVAENFIKDGTGRIYLIDWEYSGMNDPMADFAALFLENNFSEENRDYMLNLYFDGSIPANTRMRIHVYQILWDFLWTLWTWIKEAQGDDFGTYGMDRYRRAIALLDQMENEKI